MSSLESFGASVAKLLASPKTSSSNSQTFRQALRAAEIVATDEKQLADIIVGVLPSVDDVQKWNLDVIVEVLHSECNIVGGKKINWKRVVELLDHSHLSIRSMDDFQLLTRLFLRISGTIFPASGLVGTWNNRTAQLYMLILAANSPRPDLVDFSDMVSIDQRIRDAPLPQNLSYLCLPLYNALLDLAERGMQSQVWEI